MLDTAQWESDENRESFRRHAFVAWSHLSTLTGMFGGKNAEPPTFGEYLDSVGLGDAKQDEPELNTTEDVLNYIDNLFGSNPNNLEEGGDVGGE